MDLKTQLKDLSEQAKEQMKTVHDLKALDEYRIEYLGRKGKLTQLLKQMKDLPKEEKPVIGQLGNQIRQAISQDIEELRQRLQNEALSEKLKEERLDVTLPGRPIKKGQRHIIQQIIEEIEDLFLGMGYSVEGGTEIVSDTLNFERVNVPAHHPARDMQDSFYINDHYLLRTQTSAVQPLILENHDFSNGPIKVISPGKVYRRDSDDATHSHQFFQIEGIVVDEKITMGDLFGTLKLMSQEIFGKERDIRFRPSYFPFTEPSVEVDVSCFKCGGKGCHVCKQTGWIEILGAGMIHPNVLEMSGIDSDQYMGFAFGVGPDRMAMLKYGVDDIRQFYLNDERFLAQFSQEGAEV